MKRQVLHTCNLKLSDNGHCLFFELISWTYLFQLTSAFTLQLPRPCFRLTFRTTPYLATWSNQQSRMTHPPVCGNVWQAAHNASRSTIIAWPKFVSWAVQPRKTFLENLMSVLASCTTLKDQPKLFLSDLKTRKQIWQLARCGHHVHSHLLEQWLLGFVFSGEGRDGRGKGRGKGSEGGLLSPVPLSQPYRQLMRASERFRMTSG